MRQTTHREVEWRRDGETDGGVFPRQARRGGRRGARLCIFRARVQNSQTQSFFRSGRNFRTTKERSPLRKESRKREREKERETAGPENDPKTTPAATTRRTALKELLAPDAYKRLYADEKKRNNEAGKRATGTRDTKKTLFSKAERERELEFFLSLEFCCCCCWKSCPQKEREREERNAPSFFGRDCVSPSRDDDDDDDGAILPCALTEGAALTGVRRPATVRFEGALSLSLSLSPCLSLAKRESARAVAEARNTSDHRHRVYIFTRRSPCGQAPDGPAGLVDVVVVAPRRAPRTLPRPGEGGRGRGRLQTPPYWHFWVTRLTARKIMSSRSRFEIP